MDRTRGKRIGEGRTADILAWGDGRALKLYKNGWPLEDVEYEAKLSRIVYATGAAAPAVGDIIEVDGRHGFVIERIDGPTMLASLQQKPWRLAHYARLLADLHADMHACHVPDLPAQRGRLERMIAAAPPISPAMKRAALQALQRLPDSDRLCHGDFHPLNVILSPGGPVTIDWVDVAGGSPHADVARTLLLARMGSLHVPVGPARLAARIVLALFTAFYLRRYLKRTRTTRQEIGAWELPVAAARLNEGVQEEEDALVRLVESSARRAKL